MKEMAACNLIFIFWFAVIIVLIAIQRILNDVVQSHLGDITTSALMVMTMSIVYGRFFLCSNHQKKKSISEDINTEQKVIEKMHDTFEFINQPSLLGNSNDDVILSNSNENNGTLEEGNNNNVLDSKVETSGPTRPTTTTTVSNKNSKERIYFLDNIKSFLTFLVVSFHMTCAFGGCGNKFWILIVGLDLKNNTFSPFEEVLVILNQAYFMPFFFFISGYFVPISYERKGSERFLKDKAKRLWLPAFFVTFVVAPLLIVYCQWFIGNERKNFIYYPNQFHCWYLYWLLLLSLIYVQIRERQEQKENSNGYTLGRGEESIVKNNHSRDKKHKEVIEYVEEITRVTNNCVDLPGPMKRTIVFGGCICGLVVLLLIIILKDKGFFAGMPIVIGSLPNDILLFFGGVIAKQNGWLVEENKKSLREQLGMPVAALRCMIVVEAIITVIFVRKILHNPDTNIISICIAFIAAGMYCIDMILALCEFFQSNFNFQNQWTKFFSDTAYTVYLIHPIVIVGITSLWIVLYEHFITINNHDNASLVWNKSLYSDTAIHGGGIMIGISWSICNILSHAIVWPLSYYLRKLPGLREIL